MGNDQINLKKARILNNDAYAESIEEFSEKYCNTEDSHFAKTQTNAELFQSSGIHVCVRKRPLWQKEIDKGEWGFEQSSSTKLDTVPYLCLVDQHSGKKT